jgi:hypothetical protein
MGGGDSAVIKTKSLFCLASLPLHLQEGVILAASKGKSHILDLLLAGSFLNFMYRSVPLCMYVRDSC